MRQPLRRLAGQPESRDLQDDQHTQQAIAAHRLRRSRLFATGLLVTMLIALVALHGLDTGQFWVRFGIAAAEAAVVGGLADWFAVTALFRHPLGVPVPHTAIIPNNKQRIARGIGQFIDQHFLDAQVMTARVHAFAPADWLAGWLVAPDHARGLAMRLVGVLPSLLQATEDADLRRFLASALRQPWQNLGIGPVVGKVVSLAIANGQHRPALLRLLHEARRYIDSHEARLEAAVQQRSSWWVPKTVDKKLARSVVDALRDLVAELHDPASTASQRLDASLQALVADTLAGNGFQGQWQHLLDTLTHQPGFAQWRQEMWRAFSATCTQQAGSADSAAVLWLAGLLQSFGQSLQQDPAMRAKIDELAERLPGELMTPLRASIRDFVVDVVQGWDTVGLIARLELTIGADLQYLRVSGTVVAACVGSALFLLTEWMAG